MDLALLVYGISLLHGVSVFFMWIIGFCILAAVANFIHWVDYCNTDEAKKACAKRIWTAFYVGVAASWVIILTPTEKTAYTMAGAYAAQKVAENDKVQVMSSKVLTIIEQKLDTIIEDGIKEAKDKVEKVSKKK